MFSIGVSPLGVFTAACRYMLLPASPISMYCMKGGGFISLVGSLGEYYAFPPSGEGEGEAQASVV